LHAGKQRPVAITTVATCNGDVAEITSAQLKQLALLSAIPMVGFGFVDNLIMIMAGDVIDARLGLAFGVTTMAAAGLGNAVSDAAGVYLGGYIEIVAAKMGMKDPKLTKAQAKTKKARLVSTTAAAFGIIIGCLLGMIPLLAQGKMFKSKEEKALEPEAPQVALT